MEISKSLISSKKNLEEIREVEKSLYESSASGGSREPSFKDEGSSSHILDLSTDPLYIIDIIVGDNQTKRMEIYEGENIKAACNRFCILNGIPDA